MERKTVYWIGLAVCVVAVLGPPSVCSAQTVIFTPPSWDTRAASATIKGSEVEYIIESGSQTAPRRYLLSQWNGTDPSPFITVVVWSPATRESVQVSAFGVPGQGAGATVLEFQVGTTRLTEVAASVVQAVNQNASVGLAGLSAAMSTTMLRHDLARMVTDLSTTAFGATTPCVHGLAMLALSSGSAAVPGLEAFSDQWTASARDLIVPNTLYQDPLPPPPGGGGGPGPLGNYVQCLQNACVYDCGGTWEDLPVSRCHCNFPSIICAACYTMSIYPCLFELIPWGPG